MKFLLLALIISQAWKVTSALGKDDLEGLSGEEVRVSALGYPPFLRYNFDAEGVLSSITGVDVDLLALVGEKLNFTFVVLPQQEVGVQLPNGTWTGVIGQVNRSIAHFGVGHVALSYQRHRGVGFSVSLYSIALHMLSLHPKALPVHFNFLRAFEASLWLALCTSLLLVSITLEVLAKGANGMGGISSTLLLLHLTLGQSAGRMYLRVRRVSSLRLFLVFLLLPLACFKMAYNCNILTSLLSQPYSKAINTPDDALGLKERNIFMDDAFFREVIRDSSVETLQKLYQRSLEHNDLLNLAPGDFTWAYNMIDYDATTFTVAPIFNCLVPTLIELFGKNPFRIAPNSFTTSFAGIVMPKNAPYFDRVNELLLRMVDNGLVNKLIERNTAEIQFGFSILNFHDESQGNRPLHLDHLIGALIVLFAGLLIALVIFAVEKSSAKMGSEKGLRATSTTVEVFQSQI